MVGEFIRIPSVLMVWMGQHSRKSKNECEADFELSFDRHEQPLEESHSQHNQNKLCCHVEGCNELPPLVL